MSLPLFSQSVRLGLLGWGLLLTQSAAAQLPVSHSSALAPARPFAVASEAANPRLDYPLRQVLGQARVFSLTELQGTHPDLRFGQGSVGTTVLVRVMARDVNALLPALLAHGFEVTGSAPQLHFVEGRLPVGQLDQVNSLVGQGLLGVVACLAPVSSSGLVTSQGDYVLEADRTRATKPKSVTGSGVTVGVLSNSFNALGGAAADVASGDLPVVNVLKDTTGTTYNDEGRAMCQIIHDLAPGAGLAFSTAEGGESKFAQHIRDLAEPSKGNCQVITDDIRYYEEPMFQDGVIAQAITEVVTTKGVAYFASAGNYASKSYENMAPQFITGANGVQYLNFDPSGATQDVTQRLTIPDGGLFKPVLQWSDPFYTVDGVRTDLNIFLVAVKNGLTVDTVARSITHNISIPYPLEYFTYTNSVATSGTTTFDVVITLKQGQVPSILKYIDYARTTPAAVINEWDTKSSTVAGHSTATEAFAVAAVPYYNQRTPESFTSRGGALPFLFAPDGTALPTPVTRQKPDIAAIDGGNNTFFGTDLEGDGFPNFLGTSAAAPHAAAVAALLRASEPSLTPSQVYSRLAGSARLLGSSNTDPFTGSGLVDAFTALYGPVVAATPPIVEDLEQGALPTSWWVGGTGAARTQVSTQAPATGQESLILDAYPYSYIHDNTIYSLTEATLYVQGAASASNLTLSFSERKFVAETDEQMPAQFQGYSNSDGVALSVDGGTTWYRVFDLTGANATTTFQTQSLNLTQLASTLGLTLGNDVRLRFQRYGAGGSTAPNAADAAGRVFDDIQVSAGVLSLSSAARVVGLEAWPVPAPGGSALNLRLPPFSGAVSVRLVDNLGRVVWQRQLSQSGSPWESTVPLPAATGLYNLLYQPEGAPAAAQRVLVQ